MGAIAIGLRLMLLIDSAHLSGWRITSVVALAVIDPMFSGTAIPGLFVRSTSCHAGRWRDIGRLIAFAAGTREVSGEARAATENGSEQRTDASYRSLAGSPPTAEALAAPADPLWAPKLTGGDIVKLVL